jgi:hypothetical protein
MSDAEIEAQAGDADCWDCAVATRTAGRFALCERHRKRDGMKSPDEFAIDFVQRHTRAEVDSPFYRVLVSLITTVRQEAYEDAAKVADGYDVSCVPRTDGQLTAHQIARDIRRRAKIQDGGTS